jgi:hypothetical protein
MRRWIIPSLFSYIDDNEQKKDRGQDFLKNRQL